MRLLNLQLENFRNYDRYELKFDAKKNINVFTGPNGIGKTNILEAIYVLSLGKSFRTVLQDNLILWGMDYMRCTGEVEDEDDTIKLEVSYSNYPQKKKIFKRNDVALTNSEYFGTLLTVFFHPEDLNMLCLTPSLRRKYINILLSQTDRKYLEALLKYNRVIKQRNRLLQQILESKMKKLSTDSLMRDLEAWNEETVTYGSILIKARNDYVKFLNKKISSFYKSISGGKEKVSVKYINNVLNEEDLTLSEIHKLFTKKIADRVERAIFQRKTITGPHRDDLEFCINEKSINSSASRGEFRTLLLAIKLSEIEYLKTQTKKSPVLLLDDVFSELDDVRQTKLFDAISDCQTIISTTNLSKADKLAKNANFLPLDDVG